MLFSLIIFIPCNINPLIPKYHNIYHIASRTHGVIYLLLYLTFGMWKSIPQQTPNLEYLKFFFFTMFLYHIICSLLLFSLVQTSMYNCTSFSGHDVLGPASIYPCCFIKITKGWFIPNLSREIHKGFMPFYY